MKIFYEKIPSALSEEEKKQCFSLIENERKDKLSKCMERKQTETLYSHMVAKKEIAKILGCGINDITFEYDENSKPKLKGQKNLYFSISHSFEYVAVAVSDKPVGVDIEKIRPVSQTIINRVCSKAERTYLKESTDEQSNFIKLWTLKESYLKAIGTGIIDNMKNCSFTVQENKAYMSNKKINAEIICDVDGYIISAIELTEKKEKTRSELIQRSITKKFRKTIWNKFIGAVKDYELIQEGDKIAVCISGGKDSMLMALCIKELIAHSQIPFEAKYIVMDPGYNEENRQKIIENAKILGLDVNIFESPIFDYVAKQNISPCYLCARMRRGYLYKYAQDLGCNKIALGHHFDDVIETILLNLFYGSEIKTMMPKLKSTNFVPMELIRPMYMVKEEDIIKWAEYNELEFIRCACRFTEKYEELGIEDEQSHKREEMKNLIKQLKKDNPYVDISIFKSVHNVNLSTIVAYRDKDSGQLYSFTENY